MKKGKLKLNKVVEGLDRTLHFRLEQSREGWLAQCEEIKGIITGGTNANPSQEEIVAHIRDAVRAALNLPARSSLSRLPIRSVFTVGGSKSYAR